MERKTRRQRRKAAARELARRRRLGVLRHIRGYFLAGILITAPFGLTIYFAWLVIDWVDDAVTPIIPEHYNPETYLPFGLPGLGLLLVVVSLTLIGAVTAGVLGRFWISALERMMASGAKGAKITLAGRIGGAEISRVEKYKKGSVPTQTLREEIDYASTHALLKRGYVGIKVWIHKKED